MSVSRDTTNRILTTTLDRYTPKISNELARNDAIVGMFGANGAIKMVTGGMHYICTIDNAENGTFAFRDKKTEIAHGFQDTRKQAVYSWATLDGTVELNSIEEAINSGDTRIYDLVESEIENAKVTIIRKIADSLRATTPGALDHESIVSLIPDTAVASQTTSTGGLSRSTTANWKSQYSNTSYDLSATAGLEGLTAFYLDSCSKGSSKDEQPNFGLTTGTLFAALSAGHGDALRRYTPDATMLKLGFQNIQVMGATIVADPSMVSGDLRLINTKYLYLACLKTGNTQNVGDRPNSMPISVGEFQKAYNSWNRCSVMGVTFALVCSSLQRQGIATNCS